MKGAARVRRDQIDEKSLPPSFRTPSIEILSSWKSRSSSRFWVFYYSSSTNGKRTIERDIEIRKLNEEWIEIFEEVEEKNNLINTMRDNESDDND